MRLVAPAALKNKALGPAEGALRLALALARVESPPPPQLVLLLPPPCDSWGGDAAKVTWREEPVWAGGCCCCCCCCCEELAPERENVGRVATPITLLIERKALEPPPPPPPLLLLLLLLPPPKASTLDTALESARPLGSALIAPKPMVVVVAEVGPRWEAGANLLPPLLLLVGGPSAAPSPAPLAPPPPVRLGFPVCPWGRGALSSSLLALSESSNCCESAPGAREPSL